MHQEHAFVTSRRAYKFRLYPTKRQARLLEETREECRWLYNQLLEQRILAYKELDLSLTKYQQTTLLPLMKLERTSLELVHSQVLQNVVDRLDKSFQAFFRRVKEGEKPGFPRFRGFHRYDSFCYPQSGFSFEKGLIKLSKIGHIKIKQHRTIQGTLKTCTILKEANGAWYVSLSCEVQAKPLPKNNKAIALDVGLENFATLSDGTTIQNPRFFKKDEKALGKAQRKLSKLDKGTPERRKAGKACAKIHRRIRNRRENFCHQLSRQLINEYQYICVEDLNVKEMVQGSYLAKSITDASWSQFNRFLSYKAEDAGRNIGAVNPAYTSQTCSQCGHVQAKELSERLHICQVCGYEAHRDFNAARNILALGLDGLGAIPRSSRLQARE